MKLTNPLVIAYVPANEKGTVVKSAPDMLEIPMNAQWKDFKSAVVDSIKDPNLDYVMLTYMHIDEKDLQDPRQLKSLDIQANTILSESSKQGLRVFNRHDDQLYFLNPSFDETKSLGKGFVPNDAVVLAKRDQYPDDYDWQAKQADVISKFGAMMELTSGKPFERTNHKAQLTDPSRGLSGAELDGFFSWKANKPVIPGLMGDNMVGMPSIKATSFDDIQLSYRGTDLPTTPLNLKTVGLQGIMIPMCNPRGDAPKYQIATDVSPINIILKARAADGVSIQKSEFYDKSIGRFGEYNFKLDGKPSHLTVERADNQGVTFSDAKGTFDVKMKQEAKQILLDRGYELPELIDSIKPNASAKYIWMSPGTMIGSKAINNSKVDENNRISPSVSGFVTAREPQNGSDEYVVLVAEGALKGVITAKYLDKPDVNGKSVADYIGNGSDRGIIIAQVPGVAAAFVKSVDRVYSEHNVVGTYIAMDADGRDNLSVAKGIHSAYDELSQHSPVKVMSWDPEQKGIDDALISLAQHKITLEDMDIHFGNPEKLFPLEGAEAPNPYKLDGTRANKQAWVEEYTNDKAARDKKISDMQASSSENVQLSLDGLSDTDELTK